jgi:hypothetical protein
MAERARSGDPGSVYSRHLHPLGRRLGKVTGYGWDLEGSDQSAVRGTRQERRCFLERAIEDDWEYLWIDVTHVKASWIITEFSWL